MVVIHAHGLVGHKSINVCVQLLSKKLDFTCVHTVQFIPGGHIRVNFLFIKYRNEILCPGMIDIDGHHILEVTESDSPLTSVYVHYYTPEASDDYLHLMLHLFGRMVDITHQRHETFRPARQLFVWLSINIFCSSVLSVAFRAGCGAKVSW